jgi:hypothetical protein
LSVLWQISRAREDHESRQLAFGAKTKLVNDAWFSAEGEWCFEEDEGMVPAVIPRDPIRRVLLQPWSEEIPAGPDSPYVTPARPLQGKGEGYTDRVATYLSYQRLDFLVAQVC